MARPSKPHMRKLFAAINGALEEEESALNDLQDDELENLKKIHETESQALHARFTEQYEALARQFGFDIGD